MKTEQTKHKNQTKRVLATVQNKTINIISINSNAFNFFVLTVPVLLFSILIPPVRSLLSRYRPIANTGLFAAGASLCTFSLSTSAGLSPSPSLALASIGVVIVRGEPSRLLPSFVSASEEFPELESPAVSVGDAGGLNAKLCWARTENILA